MSIVVYHGCRFLWGHFINLVVLKVVEIAPAFQLDPHLRDRLHADAVNLAKQVRFLKKKMMKGKPHNSSQLPPSLFVVGVRLTNIEDAAEVSSNLRYKQKNFLVNQTILFMLWNSFFVLCCCCGSMWKRCVPLRAEVAHQQLSVLLSLCVVNLLCDRFLSTRLEKGTLTQLPNYWPHL